MHKVLCMGDQTDHMLENVLTNYFGKESGSSHNWSSVVVHNYRKTCQ